MNNSAVSKSNKSFILILCAGVFLGFLTKLFVIDVLHVSGTSMEPAIKDGTTLAVNKLAYGIILPYSDKLLVQWAKPKRGDIVIYLYNNKIVVKRCVALSGDLLEYSSDSVYTLYVGGKEIPLTEVQYKNLRNTSEVPDGYILAVGDNYESSVDSRNYGFVSERNILGKVICGK